MAKKSIVSPEMLRKLLRYEPETGKLFWLERTTDLFSDGGHSAEHNCNAWNAKFANKEAFTATQTGYRIGRIWDRPYLAHRVIWAMLMGKWPTNEIDHIDHDRGNNRTSNLRAATRRENSLNISLPSHNTSGAVGVSWHKALQKWRARIVVREKSVHLGCFQDFSDAVEARKTAGKSFSFHDNHGKQMEAT